MIRSCIKVTTMGMRKEEGFDAVRTGDHQRLKKNQETILMRQ